MIDTTTALAEWTVTGLNHHSETLLFRLPHHRWPDCLSCSFARRTAPSTSFYSWPTPSSSSSPPTRCSSSKKHKTSIYSSTCLYYNQPSPSTMEYSFSLVLGITSQTQAIDQKKRSEEGTRTTAGTCCWKRELVTIENGRR